MAVTDWIKLRKCLYSHPKVAYAARVAPPMSLNTNILVNLSGRGDKDLGEVALVERGSS